VRVLLVLHGDEVAEAAMTAADREAVMNGHVEYAQRLREAGAFVLGEALAPSSAGAVVHPAAGGGAIVTDGPYAETKEQLGGVYVIECADRAAALRWAADVPPSPGLVVEVRPIAAM
jgi:hypothetical protein